MSTDLYATGIWFIGQKGRAKHDGVEVSLRRPPSIGKLMPDRMEFVPALKVATLAERSVDPVRDMTAAEISDANWWLINMAARAREFAG